MDGKPLQHASGPSRWCANPRIHATSKHSSSVKRVCRTRLRHAAALCHSGNKSDERMTGAGNQSFYVLGPYAVMLLIQWEGAPVARCQTRLQHPYMSSAAESDCKQFEASSAPLRAHGIMQTHVQVAGSPCAEALCRQSFENAFVPGHADANSQTCSKVPVKRYSIKT